MYFLHPHFSHLIDKISDAQIVRFEQFSDGWPRIFLKDRGSIADQDITYIWDFRHVEDLFAQIAFLDGLARYNPKRLDIVIPFFSAASMERDTPSGELSIAHVFARIFGLIGDRLPWRVHVHIYDIHDEREIFYFPPSLQIHHHTTTSILKSLPLIGGAGGGITPNLSYEQRHQKPIILFPDAGAKKAFSRFFDGYEVVTCAKVRKWPSEIEMYFEGGNLDGREVFIIDDHIRSGGTLIEACRYAREKWATTVSAFAPHAVFADGVKSEFLEVFDAFYTTDTIPLNLERFAGNDKVQVLSFWSH